MVFDSSIVEKKMLMQNVKVNLLHFMSIDSKSTAILKMNDEFMQGIGIMKNDYLVVQLGIPAKIGDIVICVASWLDSYYVRRYCKNEWKQPYYEATDPEATIFGPDELVEIKGVVTGVFRRTE